MASNINTSDITTIIRNVTGRNDSSDPQFSDGIMLQYISRFMQLQMSQDLRLFENRTWWTFSYGPNDADPFPVDLQGLGYTTIGPPAYVGGFNVHWYQDPADFYAKWPETQTYQEQRPVDILYYNRELTFRGPPDQSYSVKIQAYEVQITPENPGSVIDEDYLYRYIAYGAALDIFSDFGEIDQYNRYYPIFLRYRGLVTARTNQQLMTQRAMPNF